MLERLLQTLDELREVGTIPRKRAADLQLLCFDSEDLLTARQ